MKTNLTEIIAVSLVTLITTEFCHASILQEQKDVGWFSKRDLTSAQFSQNFDDYRSKGYLMIDVDAYPYQQETRYSVVQGNNPDGRGWAENRDMSSDTYHEKWLEYKKKGHRPIDVEHHQDSGESSRWAGIWAENASRFNYSKTGELDSAIKAYGDTNNLPGISVAIIENGNTLYRRGFKFAEQRYGRNEKYMGCRTGGQL